jgi:phosphoglycerate dehydrogenase-like enzyme
MRDAVVWCNLTLPPRLRAELSAALGPRLIWAKRLAPSNLPTGESDEALADADVAFGQPDASQSAQLARLRWIQLSSAGWAPFEAPAVREVLTAQGTILTTSSSVFAEPCAQHALAFLLAHARQLPLAFANQHGPRGWPKAPMRQGSRLLRGTVLLVGMGTIARRLAALLSPFGLEVIGVRRRPLGDEGVPTIATEALPAELPRADYVIDILPGGRDTNRFFDAARFAAMKPGAVFINIGRGTTVDQEALARALGDGHLGAAFLDVTDPEPLPSDHPLWTTPRCTISPHSAGGHADEPDRLVAHFLSNWKSYAGGNPAGLRDRAL